MKCFSCLIAILLLFTAPTFASVDISSPSNGETVSSPFSLSAYASSCSSQSISSMGYSLDSSDTTILHGSTSIDTKVSASVGSHTLHVKAWGDNGAVCVTDAAIKVSSASDDVTSDTSVVPSNARSVSNIESLSGWAETHDSATSGSSSGRMAMVGSPSHGGATREFVTTYKNSSGERYSVSFGDDTTSTNFLYDAWIYFTSSASNIANLELDLNQTMSNGQTVIFGFQCDGYSGTWDYSENTGTADNPKGHWATSSAHCNPRTWTTGKWHHVQVSYSRTSGGHVTYQAVWLDGVKSTINATVFAARSLGWGSSLSTNFQIDGHGSSGTITAYLGGLTIYRW